MTVGEIIAAALALIIVGLAILYIIRAKKADRSAQAVRIAKPATRASAVAHAAEKAKTKKKT